MMPPARVLITGASTGMGRATALLLAERGYQVIAASRSPERLEGIHEGIVPRFLDLKDPQSVKDLMEKIGPVEALINNAGYGLVSTVEEVERGADA